MIHQWNYFKIILIIMSLSFFSVKVFAQSDVQNQPIDYIATGFILGIDAGSGTMHKPGKIPGIINAFDGMIYQSYSNDYCDDFVYGIHAGYGYAISAKTIIGLELGYKNFAKSFTEGEYHLWTDGSLLSNLRRDYKQQGFDLLLTGHQYLYKGFNIFGKIGIAYIGGNIDQSLSSLRPDELINMGIPITTLNGSSSIWKFEPEFSIGIGYTFWKHFDVHLAYAYVGGVDQKVIESAPESLIDLIKFQPQPKVYSSSMVNIGVSYSF